MNYKKKVKFHYDMPIYIKEYLVEIAKKNKKTATETLTNLIIEEFKKKKSNSR